MSVDAADRGGFKKPTRYPLPTTACDTVTLSSEVLSSELQLGKGLAVSDTFYRRLRSTTGSISSAEDFYRRLKIRRRSGLTASSWHLASRIMALRNGRFSMEKKNAKNAQSDDLGHTEMGNHDSKGTIKCEYAQNLLLENKAKCRTEDADSLTSYGMLTIICNDSKYMQGRERF